MTQPESVVSDGNILTLWVPNGGIADPDNPTVAELTAGTVLDMTGYFTDTGWNPNVSEDEATDNRLNSRDNYGKPGRRKVQMPLAEPTEDEAALTLEPGSLGYFVDRRGVPDDQDVAAGDIVTVFPVTLGVQSDSQLTANTPQTIMQQAYLRPPGRSWRVEVAA
jgi:hypothetical protein